MSRITPYGAFLTLEGGKMGLVHISEIDRNYVKDVHEHLRENDVVQAKVIAIKEDGKIDLSIKALQDPAPTRQRRGSDPDFEARLKKFMRQSEERQVDFTTEPLEVRGVLKVEDPVAERTVLTGEHLGLLLELPELVALDEQRP